MKLKIKSKNQRRSNKRRLVAATGEWSFQKKRSPLAQLKLAVKRLSPSWQACIPLATIIVLAWGYAAVAQNATPANIVAWLYLGKPDLSMIINSILAGLVAVTAGCAFVSVPWSAVIGLVAGIKETDATGFTDSGSFGGGSRRAGDVSSNPY